jgi:hypothetical protein
MLLINAMAMKLRSTISPTCRKFLEAYATVKFKGPAYVMAFRYSQTRL